jgi:hypothetical protein
LLTLADLVLNSGQSSTSDDFFLSHWHFTDITGTGIFDAPSSATGSELDYWVGLGQAGDFPIPPMVDEVDNFAKSFYSAVLTDLGQNDTNLLINESTLEYLQTHSNMDVDSVTQGYNATALKDLRATPATLFMQYECSVPVLKGVGSVFISVLLANLVFLQALWVLLNWGSTWWLHRQDPRSNYCPGCQKSQAEYALLQDVGGPKSHL